jgi:trigger factor
LDDEFAKDVSEFDSYEEYKNSIREKLQKTIDENAKIETENQLLDKISERAVVDVPPVMIEHKIDQYIKDFDRSLKYQGFDLKKYIEITGGDYQSFREKFNERAEKEVKSTLVVEKIGKIENIQVSDDEIDAKIRELAESNGDTYENFLKYVNDEVKQSLKETLIYKKTIDFLIDNAIMI